MPTVQEVIEKIMQEAREASSKAAEMLK